MQDSAPAGLATDADVWTSDGVVLPWRPSTATDAVILVSVTGSDAALEEFPSELEEFPSEKEERRQASLVDGLEFLPEDGNLDDLFAAESPPTVAAEATPVRAAEPTPTVAAESTPIRAAEPTLIVAAESTPVRAAEPTPMVAAESAPIRAAEPTLIVAAESTPAVAAEPTPSVVTERAAIDLFAAERPAAVAAEPTSIDLFVAEPTPSTQVVIPVVVPVVVPTVARAATVPRLVRSAGARSTTPFHTLRRPTERPILTHAATQSHVPAPRTASYRRLIGVGVAAALIVTAMTVARPRTSLFSSETAAPEPIAAPLSAAIPRAPDPVATPPSTQDGELVAPQSDDEPVSSVAADAHPPQDPLPEVRLPQEPARVAAESDVPRQVDPPVRSQPTLAATRSVAPPVAPSGADVLPDSYVRPAAPIVSAPQFVAMEPIVPTLLSPRPPVSDLVAAPSAPESTPPIAASVPTNPAVAPAAPAGDTSTPTSRVAADSSAVQDVLGRYRTAFSGLNAGAAASVWPTVDAKALGKAFERLETQQIEFDRCDVVVAGARAVATCGGRARYVPKVGNKTAQVESRQWRFDLRKLNERWLIDAVSAR